MPQLVPGHYDLKVKAKGFQAAESKDVLLNIAQRAIVDVALQLGSTSSTIEVTAQAKVLNTDTASLGQPSRLSPFRTGPLSGRNYLTLGSLSPGVLPQIPNSQAWVRGEPKLLSADDGTAGPSIYVGGQRESSTSSRFSGAFFIRSSPLGGEFFNAFNNIRFDSPNLNTSSIAFGQLVSAEPARIIQVAMRLLF